MLAIAWDNAEGRADLAREGGNLLEDDTLRTAVLLSWFTDARATPAQLERFGLSGQDPRGWWGDTFPDVDGDAFGSVLWLWERSKKGAREVSALRAEARRALQWLIDDRHVRAIEVVTSSLGGDLVELAAVITLPDGSPFRVEVDV